MARILALGAFLKNQAGLWQHGRWQASAHHGDLRTPAACAALQASAQALIAAADGPLDAIAHDLHPDFFSTRLAHGLAAEHGVPALAVQHHLAHLGSAAAAQSESGAWESGAPWLGLVLDGYGLGSDGQAWGGELLAWQGPRWRRMGHLETLPMPGADRAAEQPWRMAAAALHALGRGHEIAPRWGPAVGQAQALGVQQLLARGLRCPPSSSAGRWFDAAAAALGLCLHQAHEAEAAQALQAQAQRWPGVADPPLASAELHADGRIDLCPVLAWLLSDAARADLPRAAHSFHAALADALVQAAGRAAAALGARRVALAGGCFVNPLLRERIRAGLQACGLAVAMPALAALGDAGLAHGQAWCVAQALRAGRLELSPEAFTRPTHSPPCSWPHPLPEPA